MAPAIPGDGLASVTGKKGVDWVAAMVHRLGFVQLDPIVVVARAHDQILFARRDGYRPTELRACVERTRTLFENWSHDAAILPSEHFPYWRHCFKRFKNHEVHSGYRRYFAAVTPQSIAAVRRHIKQYGPTRPAAIKSEKADWDIGDWPVPTVAKVTIEFLWRIGELAVTRRDGQAKLYDLASRVLPAEAHTARVSRSAQIDWSCREALRRLGAATPSQIAHFFDAVSTREAERWCRQQPGLLRVPVEMADRSFSKPLYMLADTARQLDQVPKAAAGLRLLSPFDPLIHDRKRTSRVFGFDYTVEIFVPAAKRKYGYYVLPILEGDRFTGRIDLKIDRKAKRLDVLGLWWEPGVKDSPRRLERLRRRLERQARFAGVDAVGSF